ncbi:MAG: UvrD-helicase domain-containing protein, partial [Solirubrobacteraceae bacterium]
LRAHSRLAGVTAELNVLDEITSARMRRAAFDGALAEWVGGHGDAAVDLLAAYGAGHLREMVEWVHAELRSRGEMRPRVPRSNGRATAGAGAAEEACVLLDSLLTRFSERYEEDKQRRGVVDFDDLELLGGRLLRQHPSVRERWRSRFELLMVDELQDVNRRQVDILIALDRENLFTVGDELQAIYGFRHADVSLFTARRTALAQEGRALALTHNFRSHAEIIAAVNAAFGARMGDGFTPLVAGRPTEWAPVAGEARAADAEGPRVELLLSDDEFRRVEAGAAQEGPLSRAPLTRQAEARHLAGRVRELIDGGLARAGEIVLLLRARTGLLAYAQALRELGLAVETVGGSFWDTEEVTDLMAYIRTIANPLDEEAMYGVLRSPFAGVSLDTAATVASHRREPWAALGALAAGEDPSGESPQWAASVDGADRERLVRLHALLVEQRARAGWLGVAGIVREAIVATGYEAHLASLPDGERRRANLRKLCRLAGEVEREDGPGLRRFVDRVAYMIEAAATGEQEAPAPRGLREAVRVMTIHSAKGLEFPVVCVAELGSRPQARNPDLIVDGARVGLRLKRAGDPESEAALDFEELCEERRSAQEAEEDRILYVGLTRARERLLLSGVASFARWPAVRAGCQPISWLAPALVHDLSERLGAVGAGVGEGKEPGGERAGGAGVGVRLWLNSPRAGDGLRGAPPRELRPQGPRSATSATGMARATGGGPVRAVRFPLTYTALSKIAACGYRYYLEDVLGLPEPERGGSGRRGGSEETSRRAPGSADSSPRERGRLVHAIMERMDFREGGPAAAATIGGPGGLSGGPSDGEREELMDLVVAAATSPLGRRLGTLELMREQPFAFAIEGEEALVTGAMDVYARLADGGALVVDYKSDGVSGRQDLEELVERQYAIQRRIYALAALRAGAPRVEVVHWFLLRPRDEVAATFEASQAGLLEGELGRHIEMARERGYSVSPHPHRELCAGCPGRGGLCSWSEEDTLQPRHGG